MSPAQNACLQKDTPTSTQNTCFLCG